MGKFEDFSVYGKCDICKQNTKIIKFTNTINNDNSMYCKKCLHDNIDDCFKDCEWMNTVVV